MPSKNPVHENTFQIVTTDVTDPAAGANFDYDVPDNARIEPIALRFSFAADANAANRYPMLIALVPTSQLLIGASDAAITANETIAIHFVTGLANNIDLTGDNLLVVASSDQMFLNPGDSLQSAILNIQAGDQISNIRFRYKLWTLA